MKRLYKYTLQAAAVATCMLAAVGSASAQREKLAIAGSSWNTIAIIDKESGQVEWRYRLPRGSECNSVEVLPDGNVLFSYRRGARLMTRDSVTIWDFTDLGEKAEVQTAKQLPDGGFLLGICDLPTRIVELDPEGNIRKEIRCDLGVDNPHGQFRRMAKAANGNYLIPVMTGGRLVEIDPQGNLVNEFEVGGGPFDVQEMSDGNVMVSLGNSHALAIFDRTTGKEFARLGQNDIDGTTLQFVTQIMFLEKNEHTLIANWQGYLKPEERTFPQLIEVDAWGDMVWSYDGSEDGVRFISAFYPFEEQ